MAPNSTLLAFAPMRQILCAGTFLALTLGCVHPAPSPYADESVRLSPAALDIFLVPPAAVTSCLRLGSLLALAQASTVKEAVAIGITVARNRAATLGADALVYERVKTRATPDAVFLDLTFGAYRCQQQELTRAPFGRPRVASALFI